MEQKCLFLEWTKKLGREKLQAFQDSFARTFGISLCLLSLQGKTLTIWSKSSLFCYYMMKNNRIRCIQERQNALDSVLAQRQTRTFRCYMGLTYFLAPVFYQGEIICIAYGGGVNLGPGTICAGNKLADNITVMQEENFADMLDLLQNSLDLLDLEPKGEPEALEPRDSCERAANEYLFLKHKLSRREMEIAQAVCECLGNKQIGEKLFISETTVKSHISNILAKMDMKDRMQLVMFCKEHNKE